MDETPAPAKKPSDWVRLYVLGMGLFTLVFAAAWIKWASDLDSYRDANAAAPALFGTARPPGALPPSDNPTTISTLATGVLKYIETWKDAKVKPDEGKGISIQTVVDTATPYGIRLRSTPTENTQKVAGKGYVYEEVSANFIFDQTDLKSLGEFLYNYERKSTKFRVLDLTWHLRPEKDNPIVPGVSYGNLIQGPTVKIGYRRPVTKGT